MLYISFNSESNKPELLEAVKAYQEIWSREGKKIIDTLERLSRLRFKGNVLKARISESSKSHPLTLKGDLSDERKLATLIHELIHILFVDNKIESFRHSREKGDSFEVHKLIFLFQYDVWISLYGEKFAERNVAADKRHRPKAQKLAWEWVLSQDRLERRNKFREHIKQFRSRTKTV